nr:ATP-binding protein [Nonomuraea montanisoli]
MVESSAGSSGPVTGVRTGSDDGVNGLPAGPVDGVPGAQPGFADHVRRHLTGGAELHPQPTLADLDRLLDESRALGVVVTRHDEGEVRSLSSTVERTAYRVIQEALTNAHKHAGDTRIDVFVRYLPADLEVVVRNTAPPRSDRGCPDGGMSHGGRPGADAGAGVPGSGWGLVGLRERVELAGGILVAGPHVEERAMDGARRDEEGGTRVGVSGGAQAEDGSKGEDESPVRGAGWAEVQEQARKKGRPGAGDQAGEPVWDEVGFQVLARIPAP